MPKWDDRSSESKIEPNQGKKSILGRFFSKLFLLQPNRAVILEQNSEWSKKRALELPKQAMANPFIYKGKWCTHCQKHDCDIHPDICE